MPLVAVRSFGGGTDHSEAEEYRWLNDVVCVGAGEVRAQPGNESPELVFEVAELVWEPPG